jgi:hypothetical protein
MTTPSASKAKDLLILAERMGIPIDEALRQVARLRADGEPVMAKSVISMSEPTRVSTPEHAPAPAADVASIAVG